MPDTKTTAADKPPAPQEIKAAKIREKAKQLTGINFSGAFGDQMAGAVADTVRVGAGLLSNKEVRASYCQAEFHFWKYSGPGSTLAASLYSYSWHLAKNSNSFHVSLEQLALDLDLNPDQFYAAADLLVTDGFWIVTEAEDGKPVKYRPVSHTEWAQKHPGRCTAKFDYGEQVHGGDPLAKLGRALGAILGGEKFFKNILLGVREAAPKNSTDEEILAHGKKFMALDKGKGSGIERRKRFLDYLREQEESY